MYKVGDLVKVKKLYVDMPCHVGVTTEMLNLSGAVFKIKSVKNVGTHCVYRLEGEHYFVWDDFLLTSAISKWM